MILIALLGILLGAGLVIATVIDYAQPIQDTLRIALGVAVTVAMAGQLVVTVTA